MEKKTASAIMLTLLLTSMLTLAFNVQPVKAEPAEIIIDTEVGESRFTTYPPRQSPYYWVHVQDHDAFLTRAYGGNFWYTLCGAEGTGEPLYYGTWQASLPYSGVYEVFVWIPNPDPFEYGGRVYTPTQSAIYQIYYKDGMTTRTVNQRLRTGGWYSVGTFTFATTASVILNDRTGEPYLSTMIAFDAIKFVYINNPPVLSNGYVTPSSGDTSTVFDYYVTYADPDGDSPTLKYVYIDGSPYTMVKISGDYVSGAAFKYSTTLSAGSHNYYFYFDDGHGHAVRLPTTGTYSGPNVSPPPPPFDFTLGISPSSGSVQQGGSVSATVTVTLTSGSTQTVTLTTSGLPSEAYATFNPSSGYPTFTSTFAISTSTTTPTGTFYITIIGSGGGLTRTATYTLTVTPLLVPDFSITAFPALLTIQQGSLGTSTITITSINGFYQPVQLSVSGAPSGVTATLSPSQVTPPPDSSTISTLTVSVDTTATPGSYTLTVTGTSGALAHSIYISLEIIAAPPPPNQPPNTPTAISQYKSDGVTIIPEGETTLESTVVFKATVSDPDGDSVRLEIELRQMGEAFTGEPTPETISDFVPSGSQVTIARYGLVNGDYHWRYRAKDIHGDVSDWTEFGSVGNMDFRVGLVFRPPYAVGDKYADKSAYGPWTRTYCYSSVDKITGVGAIVAAATVVSFTGVAYSEASITFIDTWRSTFSGECRIVGTFSISGDIGVWILYADAVSSIALDASLTVYDSTEGRDVLTATKPISELILYSMDNIHKSFPGSTFFLEGLLDLIEGHSYSWIFEIRLKATVATVPWVASGNAWGGIREAKLIQVCLQPPEPWSSPPEGPVYTIENALWVAVGSPVEVLVVDPDGRRVGFDFISKQEVNEIPDAWYSGPNAELQFIYIPRPLIGHYEISLAGTDRGTYALIATSIEPGEATPFRTIEIPVATNEIHQYTIDWDALSLGEEGVTVQVDSDGDRVFEHIFTSDSELTQSEFLTGTGQRALLFEIIWGEETFIVSVESNSTVYNFAFSQPDKEISFNVTGEDGTIGFCNVTIPKALLKGEPWTVLIDDAPVTFTITENATHTSLYFTYTHSTHLIQIIGTWVIAPPPPPTYSLTITTTVGGTTDPAPGTYSYTANSSVEVTAITNADYVFDHWELDTINVGSANPYTVLMDNNHTLKAVFAYSPPPPSLTASISPLSASILVGQSVTFTSTVSGGYTPYTYQWYLNGAPVSGATSSTWTFTPTTSGIYYVYLKVTDAKANTAQSETARITAGPVPVGGYSIPIQVQTKAEPVLPYIALIAILTAIFTKLRPKTKRKR